MNKHIIKILEKIKHLPIQEQILCLKKELDRANDAESIIEIQKIVGEKTRQFLRQEQIEPVSSQKTKKTSFISQAIAFLWNSGKDAEKQAANIVCDLTQAFNQLEILLLDNRIKDARSIADQVIAKNVKPLNEQEVSRFKMLLEKLKEAEKQIVQKISEEPSKHNVSGILNKLLLTSESDIEKAKELANQIIESYYNEFSSEQVKLLQEILKSIHARSQEIDGLKSENQKLLLHTQIVEKENKELKGEKQTLQQKMSAMESQIHMVENLQKEITRLKKLCATMFAYTYLQNKGLVLSEKRITFFLDEYLSSSPRGNPNSLASVRETILDHFEECCFEAYKELMVSD